MKKLEITTSLREARRFEEAVNDSFLRNEFDFEASDTILSKRMYDVDNDEFDCDRICQLKNDAMEELASRGLEEFDIQVVEA